MRRLLYKQEENEYEGELGEKEGVQWAWARTKGMGEQTGGGEKWNDFSVMVNSWKGQDVEDWALKGTEDSEMGEIGSR